MYFTKKPAFQAALVVKNPYANEGDTRCRFSPWVGKILWSRKWQPAPVFLPGKFHEQRSLAGSSAWGCRELDTTELLSSSCGLFLMEINLQRFWISAHIIADEK